MKEAWARTPPDRKDEEDLRIPFIEKGDTGFRVMAPRGPVTLTAKCHGYEPISAVLSSEQHELTLALQPLPSALLQGQVRTHGVPLQEGRLELYEEQSGYWYPGLRYDGWRQYMDTDLYPNGSLKVQNGRYSGHVRPAGSYVVRVNTQEGSESGRVLLAQLVHIPEEGTVDLDFDDVPGLASLETRVFKELYD